MTGCSSRPQFPMVYLIKRVKKFPIFDLFTYSNEGWTDWVRISYVKNVVYHLGGRQLQQSELSQIKAEITKCLTH